MGRGERHGDDYAARQWRAVDIGASARRKTAHCELRHVGPAVRGSLSAAARASIIIASCAALIGCGTNVRKLLEDDSRASWQAYSVVEQAEALDVGLEKPIYDAEAVKDEACEPIYAAAAEKISSGTLSFWDQLWSDLVQFVVLVVPIGTVETCAEAHERYEDEIVTLRYRLERFGTPNVRVGSRIPFIADAD